VNGRRGFLLQTLAALVIPWRVVSAAVPAVCVKLGLHWTLPARHWREATADQLTDHLVAVHGHTHGELQKLKRAGLLQLHDVHHDGGSFRHGGVSIDVPGYAPGSVIHPSWPRYARQFRGRR